MRCRIKKRRVAVCTSTGRIDVVSLWSPLSFASAFGLWDMSLNLYAIVFATGGGLRQRRGATGRLCVNRVSGSMTDATSRQLVREAAQRIHARIRLSEMCDY
jgi:hypothetical protein